MRKNNKNAKQVSAVKYDHPGRPRHVLQFPTRKEWTFNDLCGVNPDCSLLTCRKSLERDMYFHKPGKAMTAKNRTRVNPRSQACLIHGVTAEPESESGLGRRAKLYCIRVNKDSVSKPAAKAVTPKATKATKAIRKTRTAKIKTVTSQTPTADILDKIHTVLATPDPVPAPAALTIPAVTIAPPAPEVAPVAAPVAATPAPAVAPEVAPVVEAAPVAPEAAPVAS